MVANLVKLQLALQKAGFRRNGWAIVGLVIGLLYALGAAFGLIMGGIGLRFVSPDISGPAAVLVWSLVTLGWCLLPLLAFGVDETLDPGRFALFPLRARDLMPGLLIGGLLSPGGIFNVLAGVAFIIAWTGSLVPALVAGACAVVGILTCFLFSRVLTSALSAGLAGRRTRDIAAMMLGVIGITFSLGTQIVSRGMRDTSSAKLLALLHQAGDTLAWTPFGWIWAVPWDVAAHRYAQAGIRAALGVGLAAGLWFAWQHFLSRALVQPLEAGGGGGKVKSSARVDSLFGSGPAAAIASRSLRYWRRDSRHVVALVSMVMMPFLILVPIFINNQHGEVYPGLMSFGPAMIAMMAGIGMSNELSYDGSALWTHLTCGVSGRDDRLGRAMALSAILVPILLVAVVGLIVFGHQAASAPAMIGLTTAVYGAALGVGAVLGAVFVVPTPPPGERNAFNRGQSGGFTGLLNLGCTWGLTLLLVLPTLALAIAAVWLPWAGLAALPVGVLTAVLAAWWGIRYGGSVLDRRWPEALKAATYEKH